MLDQFLILAPWIILPAISMVLFSVLCVINQMHWPVVHKPVAVAYVLIAIGWGALWFGVLDYLVHLPPMFWPVFLLAGLAFLSIGHALLFLVERRSRCVSCAQCLERFP